MKNPFSRSIPPPNSEDTNLEGLTSDQWEEVFEVVFDAFDHSQEEQTGSSAQTPILGITPISVPGFTPFTRDEAHERD